MTVSQSISRTLSGYETAKTQPFAGHPLASLARKDLPDAIREIVPEDRYLVEGSAGQGQWAQVPWVALFDRLITTSAQQGFYVVYLFRADLSGVYLSLNQGITIIRETYGTDAKKSLPSHCLIAMRKPLKRPKPPFVPPVQKLKRMFSTSPTRSRPASW
jgi:5-methylcytosine-specific restriction protein A